MACTCSLRPRCSPTPPAVMPTPTRDRRHMASPSTRQPSPASPVAPRTPPRSRSTPPAIKPNAPVSLIPPAHTQSTIAKPSKLCRRRNLPSTGHRPSIHRSHALSTFLAPSSTYPPNPPCLHRPGIQNSASTTATPPNFNHWPIRRLHATIHHFTMPLCPRLVNLPSYLLNLSPPCAVHHTAKNHHFPGRSSSLATTTTSPPMPGTLARRSAARNLPRGSAADGARPLAGAR